MTYHALCYKHRCRGGPDAKRKKRLEQLDARIEKRLRPGELGQRAGGEDIEQRAVGEERIEQQAGKEERLEQRAGEEERIEQQAGQEAAPLEEEAVGLAAFAQA